MPTAQSCFTATFPRERPSDVDLIFEPVATRPPLETRAGDRVRDPRPDGALGARIGVLAQIGSEGLDHDRPVKPDTSLTRRRSGFDS